MVVSSQLIAITSRNPFKCVCGCLGMKLYCLVVKALTWKSDGGVVFFSNGNGITLQEHHISCIMGTWCYLGKQPTQL